MATSPPASPPPARPMSALFRAGRSSSRMSVSSKHGGGSRASDEDSKTSVKVAVRVRPPLKPSDPGYELIPQRYQRSMVHTSTSTGLTIDSPQGLRKFFVFDKVFGEEVMQDGIWDYVKDSVDSFVQGYNVSVLAYGQSGSGKSYTMGTSGPAEQSNPQQMGVIPRAAKMLFEKLSGGPAFLRSGSTIRTPTRYSMHSAQGFQSMAKQHSEKNWEMRATYVEIYNEQVRDLLVPEDAMFSERATVEIREDTKKRILLTGLHQATINSVDDLLGALNYGSTIRQTDSTAINAKSSRSHAVFSINLVQRKNKTKDRRFSMPVEAMSGADEWVTTDSKLHFVDLAGSERLKNTGASGGRAKEGISINAGLASLGKVISQLSTREAHVSYRDSKLTRLLQDSLGNDAITYMIACITPAEFHLSETLNTVEYAKRARAIQSKPQLQQVSDDSDKQAIINRLQAEVAFLRDQIQSDRGNHAPQERAERQNEREVELQNHLLDVQEDYTALSQRHAKLISEITKARDHESGETPTLTQAIGDSAVERLKRSNSFAEAVEQVVLEYEKTIQSLEISLHSTRSSLANTESGLLEKENKCAYVETLNQQLQNRLQKLTDREASNEQYLRSLEAKLDGRVSGDEKSSALVSELRKEISRIRENEAQCEEYISTLEERLAEADQDLELKQRELDRLEHVIERQRSLGKLDNLLYEFDRLPPQQNGTIPDHEHQDKPLTNGFSKSKVQHGDDSFATTVFQEAVNTAIPDSDDEDEIEPSPMRSEGQGKDESNMNQISEVATPKARNAAVSAAHLQNPAQDNAMADKLETVTEELLDLRIRHESTTSDLEMMSAKYEEALRALAEYQDALDEARHTASSETVTSPTSTRPESFLGDARVMELKDGSHLSSSRSLSSELSLAGDSNTSLEPSIHESTHRKTPSGDSNRLSMREQTYLQELDDLKKTLVEKDEAIATLHGSYSELQELHFETLDIVEELKAEVTKAKMAGPTSPTSPVIRRKSSQNVMTIDRAHRSLASLRNIAAENFEDKPDTMQSFELNLNTAMHELHQRSERVQLLEAEQITLRKEMESKMAMISGLTRERSSLKTSSPIMDMSMMSTLNDQLVQRENQMREWQEKQACREQELTSEVEELKHSLEQAEAARLSIPGYFPETPALANEATDKQLGDHLQDAERLQQEVQEWQSKHQAAVESMQASEKRLLGTITQLETSLTTVEAMKNEAENKARQSERKSLSAANFEDEIRAYSETVNSLRQELVEHRSKAVVHVDKIARLEQLQDRARQQAEEASRFQMESESQIEMHRENISRLEQQVQEHQTAVEFHKHGLKSLHDSHAREMESLQSEIQDHVTTKTEMERSLQDMQDAHTGHITRLESEVIDLKSQLDRLRGGLADELQESKIRCTELERDRDHLQQEIQMLKKDMQDIVRAHASELTELKAEKERAANLVEELEEQLSTSYDQQQANSSRLSILNNNHNSQLEATKEANAAIATLEKQLESSQNQVEQLQAHMRESQQLDRNSSVASNLRKSASATSLPSPPPAIPLPPLPAGAQTPTSSTFPIPTSPTAMQPQQSDAVLLAASHAQTMAERETHIKQLEKHLFAEKQLTATLEEALQDLENQGKKTKLDMETYKKKYWTVEEEMTVLRKERKGERYSVQAVEEERDKRREAERAREKLEERMRAVVVEQKKRRKGGFNCF